MSISGKILLPRPADESKLRTKQLRCNVKQIQCKWSNFSLLRVREDYKLLEITQNFWLYEIWKVKNFLCFQPSLSHDKWAVFWLISFKSGIRPNPLWFLKKSYISKMKKEKKKLTKNKRTEAKNFSIWIEKIKKKKIHLTAFSLTQNVYCINVNTNIPFSVT